MANIKDLLSKLATGEEIKFTIDEVKEMSDEYNNLSSSSSNKEHETELENQLKEMTKNYEDLKDRVVNSLFGGNNGDKGIDQDNPDDGDDGDGKDANSKITFNDLMNPDYQD